MILKDTVKCFIYKVNTAYDIGAIPEYSQSLFILNLAVSSLRGSGRLETLMTIRFVTSGKLMCHAETKINL